MIYKLIIGILIILIILLTCILIKERLNEKRIIKNRIEEEYKKVEKQQKERINNLKYKYDKDIEIIRKEFQSKQQEYDELFARNESFLKKEQEKINLILNQKEEIIDKELKNYKIQKENIIEKELKDKISKSIDEYNSYIEKLEISKKDANDKLEEIKNELEDYRLRRAAINEAILREKEIQEKETFFKLNISNNDIEDIEVLKTIEPKLKNKEVLNKLIYDVFIKKPASEMIKRVLNGESPSGIYKITYIPTGESYIGKSTNVNKRWQEHLKSAYNLGTIAHSSLHTKMSRDGVWNFTFELIEQVEKDKLNEREKYWINFYDTKKYGLNEREGG